MNILLIITFYFTGVKSSIMVYCLMNNCDLVDDSIKINYSIINDSEELRVNKTFNISINDDNVSYPVFYQDQFRKNVLCNYIDEMKYDFGRSKYIFGQNEFREYFYSFEEFEEFNTNFEFKYMKISDLIFGVNRLKPNLL